MLKLNDMRLNGVGSFTEKGMAWSSIMEEGVGARLSTPHWSLTFIWLDVAAGIQRLNNDWKVFIAFGNYLIQILCGSLVLICRSVIHIICRYQSAPFHYPWQIYAITHFKVCSPQGQGSVSDQRNAQVLNWFA